MHPPSARRHVLMRVPLHRLDRRGDRRTLQSMNVDVKVHDGQPDADVVTRAVHALAADRGSAEPEMLALAIARHLVVRLACTAVDVEVQSDSWGRLSIGGRERGGELTTPTSPTRVGCASLAGESERIRAGLRGLRLLSAAGPAPTPVELRLDATWCYGWRDVPWDTQWQQVRRALGEAYAERSTDALAEELARAVLAEAPAVQEVALSITHVRYAVLDTPHGEGNGAELFSTQAGHVVHEVTMTRDDGAQLP